MKQKKVCPLCGERWRLMDKYCRKCGASADAIKVESGPNPFVRFEDLMPIVYGPAPDVQWEPPIECMYGPMPDPRWERQHYGSLLRVNTGETIVLDRAAFKIGRHPQETDYVISGNAMVSRCHATIFSERDVHYVCDNASTNGTFLNGVMLRCKEKTLLRDGDCIGIGGEVFRFRKP